MMINPSLSFRDYDGHSIKISEAKYTLNSVTFPIPGSFFSIDSTDKKILVDPTPTSQIGIYSIEVSYTDGNLVSKLENFTVEVTDTKPWFHKEIPDVIRALYSTSYSIPLSSYFSDPKGETLTMSA